MILLIWSSEDSSGDSPPCMQKILSSISAATGRQLKQSVKVFHSFMLYLLLPTNHFSFYNIPHLITLIIEPVYPINRRRLMVSPQQEKVLRILYLIGQQQADRLQAVLAPVHIVSQEQVVGLGREASVLEKSQQIIILPVNVALRYKNQCILPLMLPQTLRGASSSSRMGWDMKTSLAFIHSPRTSVSVRLTCFPGFLSLTSRSFSRILSMSMETTLDGSMFMGLG